MQLDESQENAVQGLIDPKNRLVIMTGGPGCHRKGQKILRANGTFVAVENVVVGDRLAGFGGQVRVVEQLRRGFGEMAEITPVKGDPFVVNLDHILTLVHSTKNTVSDISVRDFLRTGQKNQDKSKLFRQAFDFSDVQSVGPITPYMLGVFLGDGCLTDGPRVSVPDEEIVSYMRDEAARFGLALKRTQGSSSCPSWAFSGGLENSGKRNPALEALRDLGLAGKLSGDKFVPKNYLTSTRENRLALLAGLLDTDGHLCESGSYDYISKSKQLSEDVVFLCKSLGLAAYMKPAEKYCQTGAGGIYWRVSISGHLDMLPLRVERKKAKPRQQIKNVLRTGFTVTILPFPEEFFGFTLDGDGRYLLSDFTVTHNTGKTTTLKAVLERLTGRVKLCSPTGKAAKRMQEVTGRSASTIHRLIMWGGDDSGPAAAVDADVVVVDESSMLDTNLLAALIRSMPAMARLILIGDAAQLPPVGAGQPFHDLLDVVPTFRLTKTHRQAGDSWVVDNARILIGGDVPSLENTHDFRFIETQEIEEQVVSMFVADPTLTVLSPQKSKGAGILSLNLAIQAAVNPPRRGAPVAFGGDYEFRIGDRVIQRKNDKGREIVNGDIGTITAIRGKKDIMVEFSDDRLVRCVGDQLGDMRLAYALTVHSSQGSEWKHVVLVCDPAHSFMLRRQLVYTAVTRTSDKLTVVGSKGSFARACCTPLETNRRTGLRERVGA